LKHKKICPFDDKPCPHQAGCEALDFVFVGDEVIEDVIYRCNRLPVEH